METITETEFDLQWQESLKTNQVADDVQGFDQVGNNISKWSEDSYKLLTLASGVELTLDCETMYCDCSVENQHEDFQMLVSKFYLSGNHRVVSPGIENVAPEYSESAGYNYLFYLPDIRETEQFFAGEPLQKLKINLDLAFFRKFVRGLEEIPKQLQPLVESGDAPRFHCQVGKITPMMRTVIEQIWNHPYQGAIARIYLEAKVLELLALQLSQLQSEIQPQRKLRSQDVDRLYQAQTILQQNYLNPPCITDLAQQVELDRIKLQQGFRRLFQTTPFGYLQNYRLDLAKTMLRDENLTISTVANRIGYSNISYFSRAFKRRFGITPGQCRCR